jgi:hypothetical protein
MSRRPASFTEADARRACKAAPDRTVEIHLPDGTVIRILPGDKEKPEVVKRREVRL